MSPLSSDQLEKIRCLLQTCGEQATQLAADPFQVFEKGVGDYVTTVDHALDELLTVGFNALFPGGRIITEENVASQTLFHEPHDRLWLIDPLDGTEDFIKGASHYAVMVGLLQDYQPIAGWIYAPVFKQLYYGGTELGLFQTTGDRPVEPLIPTPPPPLTSTVCPMVIGDKDRRNYGEAIAQLVPGVQFSSVGSFGLKVMQVILGQAGLYVYLNGRVKLWDTTGPLALARTAGLVCCDLDGEPIRFSPEAIAADTLTHHQTIVIGWPHYVEELRDRLKQAFNQP